MALNEDGDSWVWTGLAWTQVDSLQHNAVTLAADADTLLGLTGQQITLDIQGANLVFVGPTSGGDADPTFRSLVDADIPASIARDSELHAALHTIASHNDTTGTGAELEELTDGSETVLHSHAGGGHTIRDDGVDQTVRTGLNFIGPIITVTDDAGGDEQEITIVQGQIDHGSIGGLSDDDHAIYALLAGRAGGQTLIGATASGGDLTLQSTAHATRGSIFLGLSSQFELVETTGQLLLPTTGSGAGILIGGDVHLYRREDGAHSLRLGDGDKLEIGDDAFQLYMFGTMPAIFFDSNDYFGYSRSINTFVWHINPNTLMTLDDTGKLWLTSGGSIQIGITKLSQGVNNRLDLAAGDAFAIIGGAGDFGIPTNGTLWYNTTSGKFRVYESGAWVDMVGGGGGVDVYEDGGSIKAGATILDFKSGFDVAVDGVGVDITLDVDESPLSGLAKLAGRAGGQTLIGGTAANEDAILQATAHATRTTSTVQLLVDTNAYMTLGAAAQVFGSAITAVQFLGAPIDFKNLLGGIPVRFTDTTVGGPSVEFATGVLNVNQDIDITGHVAAGAGVAPDPYRVFNVCKSFPLGDSNYGIYIDVHATRTAGTTNTVTGLGFEAFTGSATGVTYKMAQGIYGFAFKEGAYDVYALYGASMGIATASGATGAITAEAIALWLRSVRSSATPKALVTKGMFVDDFSPWGGAGDTVYGIQIQAQDADATSTRRAIQYGNHGSPLWYVDQDGNMVLRSYTNGTRPAAGVAGRVIYNSDDGGLNVDDGANWRGPSGGWVNT